MCSFLDNTAFSVHSRNVSTDFGSFSNSVESEVWQVLKNISFKTWHITIKCLKSDRNYEKYEKAKYKTARKIYSMFIQIRRGKEANEIMWQPNYCTCVRVCLCVYILFNELCYFFLCSPCAWFLCNLCYVGIYLQAKYFLMQWKMYPSLSACVLPHVRLARSHVRITALLQQSGWFSFVALNNTYETKNLR